LKNGRLPALLLGGAYGILEEGVALITLFNPNASVVGGLGSFGHYLGVNTVWVPGVIMVHMVFSIGLPIFLLGMALPETRGRSLLSHRGLQAALGVLALDVLVLFLAIHFGAQLWMGWTLLLGSFGVIAALIYAAYRWPRPTPPIAGPRTELGGLWIPAIAGVLLFTGVILCQGLGETWGVPAAGVIATVVTVMLSIGLYAYQNLRGPGQERRQLAFALGLLAPIIVFGALAQFPFDLVLVADVALVVWFSRLLRLYQAGSVQAPAWSPPGSALLKGAG
jgi:hypothetical protein